MIFISLCLFALSGKQILRVRKKLKLAKSSQFDSSDESYPTDRNGDRRFSIFARSIMSRTITATTSDSTPQIRFGDGTANVQPDLENLAPIHCREKLDTHNTANLAPLPTPPSPVLDRQVSEQSRARNRTASRFDQIHWKYAKFAFLCTIVLLVTWIPISVNRVYNNFINPNHQIYGLYLASAACIPLHGFGNFVIYTSTSWTECRDFLAGCTMNLSSRASSSPTRNSFRRPSVVRSESAKHRATLRAWWNGNGHGNRTSSGEHSRGRRQSASELPT